MPQLTQRSLIRLGGDSLVITIPKGWLDYNNLKPGDMVQVETNGDVIIRPKGKRQRQSKSTCQGQ